MTRAVQCARPRWVCLRCGAVSRYDGSCQEAMNYVAEGGRSMEEGPCGGAKEPYTDCVCGDCP